MLLVQANCFSAKIYSCTLCVLWAGCMNIQVKNCSSYILLIFCKIKNYIFSTGTLFCEVEGHLKPNRSMS